MVGLAALWLPIVLSAVFCFIVSSIIWMVLPHHKKDFAAIGDEDGVLEVLHDRGLKPGAYSFPYIENPSEISEEVGKKLERGPLGFMWVLPSGRPKMGKQLTLWFIYLIAVGGMVAYLAGVVLEPGTHYLRVFRIVGTAATLAYCAGHFSYAIWFGQPWSNTLKSAADGFVYALITAGTFGWLWPG